MIGRLRHAREFQRLRSEGTRVRSGPLWCVMVLDPSYSSPCVAFAFGRAVGSAVERNRLRRQLRAVLRQRSETMRPGAYLFGLNRPSDPRPSFAELERAVDGLITRG